MDGPRPFEVTGFVIVILKPLPAHFSLFPPRVAFSLNRVWRAHVVHSLY